MFGAGVERQKQKGDREPEWAAVGQARQCSARGRGGQRAGRGDVPRPCTGREQEGDTEMVRELRGYLERAAGGRSREGRIETEVSAPTVEKRAGRVRSKEL